MLAGNMLMLQLALPASNIRDTTILVSMLRDKEDIPHILLIGK